MQGPTDGFNGSVLIHSDNETGLEISRPSLSWNVRCIAAKAQIRHKGCSAVQFYGEIM